MPLGVNIDAAVLRGQRRKRARTRQITVPYAPTPRGEFAETQARKEGHVHGGYTHPILGRAPTKSTGGIDLGSTASSLVDALRGLDSSGYPGSIGNVNPVRDLAENEAKNILDVAKSNYPDVFGGQADIRHVLPHLPDEKELQAGGAILSAVPVEKALEGTEAAARLAKVLSGAEKADEASPAARAARALAGGSGRRAVGRVAAKLEPDSVKAAREAIAEKAAALPKPVRTAAKVASFPVRRPILAPVAAEVPAAVLHGNPGELTKAFEGKGTFASIDNTLAQDIAPYGGEIAKEAVELPSSVLPSTFLVGKAGVEAAKGNSKELDALKKQYLATGLLPAIAEGDPGEALKRLGERPLFSALEASGALAAGGRGLGAIARETHLGGDLARADQTYPGFPNIRTQRGYSRDLLRQVVQRAQDHRTGGVVDMTKRSGRRKFERAATDSARRYSADREAIRRMNRRDREGDLEKMAPKSGVGRLSKMDTASANVVKHAIERIVQHPATFAEDLSDYKKGLEHAAAHGELNKTELALNKEMISHVEKGLKRATPEHVVDAANAFIAAHKPIVDELVAHGLLDSDQAAKAAMFPFARVHMGAQHGVPNSEQSVIAEKISSERQLAAAYEKAIAEKQSPELIASLSDAHAKAIRSLKRAEESHSQLLDPHGDPLSAQQVTAEMARRGIDPAGFISHKAASSGDFYTRPFPDRPGAPKGKRTGLSAVEGTHLGGWEAVRRQLLRSQSFLDAAKTFDGMSRFVRKASHPVNNMSEAHLVLQDPELSGLDPNIKWVPFRLHGHGASKAEVDAALEHQDPTVAQEDFLSKAIRTATDPNGADGPIGFMPKPVFDELKGQYATSGKVARGIQGVTTGYKRAVLPFSPTYHIQVPIDNFIKTGLAGINPAHMYLGRVIKGNMSPEAAASLFSAERTSSIDSLSAHRTTSTVLDGDRAVEAALRSVAGWRAKPGIKQFADAFRHTSNSLLKLNAVISEKLPEYGAVGKLAAQDFRTTQKSWLKAIGNMHKLAEEYAKGQDNPDTLLRTQKGVEDVLFNWTKLNPHTRQILINVIPFYTWIKNATKFVYVTMPLHRSVETGLLTAASRMTQQEREKFGLDVLGKEPLPGWLQGNIPLASGVTKKVNRYSSFGFFGSPAENIAGMVAPSLSGARAALEGENWKHEELGGSELSHIGLALGEFLTSFTPGFYTGTGVATKGPLGELDPVATYPPGEVKSLRKSREEISVPANGSSSSGSSTAPWESSSPSSSGTPPWESSSSSSSGKAPWE